MFGWLDFFFFFFIKSNSIEKHQKRGVPKHTGCMQHPPKKAKKRDGKTKILPSLKPNPTNQWNQIRTTISPINSLDQENKLHRNWTFSLWSKSSAFLNNFLFPSKLSKKRHKGVVPLTFFCFLLTKESCQPHRVSLTEEWITCEIPKREKSYHNTLALLQCKRICQLTPCKMR